MAEIEYKGIKVGGSKLLLIIPLIGTLIGGLWGGFEVYQRYITMEKKINSFVSPDLSDYDKRIELIQQEVTINVDNENETEYYIEDYEFLDKSGMSDVLKEDSRTNEREIKELVKEIEEDMAELEEKVADTIQKTLANPLAGMK